MSKNIVIGVVVAAVLIIGGWYFYNQKPVAQNTQPEQQVNVQNGNTVVEGTVETGTAPKTYEIIYTDSGYSPSPLTIRIGDTVVWKNQSSGGSWVGSAMHPGHIVYSGTSLQEHCPDVANTSFDECKASNPGESWSFTFNKIGSWGYHNHVNAKHFGKIIVE